MTAGGPINVVVRVLEQKNLDTANEAPEFVYERREPETVVPPVVVKIIEELRDRSAARNWPQCRVLPPKDLKMLVEMPAQQMTMLCSRWLAISITHLGRK